MRALAVAVLAVLALALAACGGGDGDAITALALQWYRDADPAACDHMTNDLLAAGWGKESDQGREACKQAVVEAGPVGDVAVAQPEITGDSAVAVVSYTLNGSQQADSLHFVREGSAWLIDDVKRKQQ
jgi:hypothetical protein